MNEQTSHSRHPMSGGVGVLMIGALPFGSSGPGSGPDRGHCVVFIHLFTDFCGHRPRAQAAMRLQPCIKKQTRTTRLDHNTGNYVPYSFRKLCGFFNVSCYPYNTEDAGDRAYRFSSLSEKTIECLSICRCK